MTDLVTAEGCGAYRRDLEQDGRRKGRFSPSLASTSPQPGAPAHSGDPDSVLGNVAQLGHALERNQDAALVMDATTMTPYTDKKTLSKERKKKIVQGSAPDDHEDKQQTHNMSM